MGSRLTPSADVSSTIASHACSVLALSALVTPPDLNATMADLARSEATPQSRTTSSERESVILRLEQYRKQLSGRATREKKRRAREK